MVMIGCIVPFMFVLLNVLRRINLLREDVAVLQSREKTGREAQERLRNDIRQERIGRAAEIRRLVQTIATVGESDRPVPIEQLETGFLYGPDPPVPGRYWTRREVNLHGEVVLAAGETFDVVVANDHVVLESASSDRWVAHLPPECFAVFKHAVQVGALRCQTASEAPKARTRYDRLTADEEFGE